MYLVLKCTTKENNYLKYVHKNIMSRIYYYYRNKYGILQEDIIICSAERATNNAGKIINFKINGIDSVKILSDIKLARLIIPYHNITLYNDTVQIITK